MAAQDNETNSRRITVFPQEPDRTGKYAEVVDASPLIYLVLGGISLLLASALGFIPMHNTAAGLVFLGIFLASFVSLTLLGRHWALRLFSRSKRTPDVAHHAEALDPHASAEETVAAQTTAMGSFLANPNDACRHDHTSPLGDEWASTIEANRKSEVDATWKWLLDCPDYEEIHATSEDNLTLVGHILRTNPTSKRWLIFAHDYDGTWLEGMLYARHWSDWGFNLLFIEQRACGASEGRLMGAGWKERRDIIAWTRALIDAEGKDIRIVLAGHAMGAAAIAGASGEADIPDQVFVGVCDSAYTDIWNVLIPLLKVRGAMVHPTIDVTSLVLRNMKGGTNLLSVRPLDGVRRSRIPLLFLHGERDVAIPPYMALDFNLEAAGSATGDNHKLVTFPHAGHLLCSLSNPELYFSTIHDFVMPYVEGLRIAEYIEPVHEREPVLGARIPVTPASERTNPPAAEPATLPAADSMDAGSPASEQADKNE